MMFSVASRMRLLFILPMFSAQFILPPDLKLIFIDKNQIKVKIQVNKDDLIFNCLCIEDVEGLRAGSDG